MNMGENLLRFNKKQLYFSFDFETCSLALSDQNNVVWEAAWILHTLDEIIEEKEYLIKWPFEIPISQDAAMMTGYYQKEAKLKSQGASPEFVLDEIEKHLYREDVISVAHNGLGFDALVHNSWRKRMGRKTDYSYIPRFLDTNCIAKAWKLGAPFPENRKDLITLQYKMTGVVQKGLKTGLKAIAPELGLEYDETKHHQALYDVQLMKQIKRKLIFQCDI